MMHFQSCKQNVECHQETIEYYSIQHINKSDLKNFRCYSLVQYPKGVSAATPKHTDLSFASKYILQKLRRVRQI